MSKSKVEQPKHHAVIEKFTSLLNEIDNAHALLRASAQKLKELQKEIDEVLADEAISSDGILTHKEFQFLSNIQKDIDGLEHLCNTWNITRTHHLKIVKVGK